MKKSGLDITTMVRTLYRDFYAGGSPELKNVSLSSVKPSDLYLYAQKSEASDIMSGILDKKWTVVDANNRIFKVHDSPHNYNLQIRAHRGAVDDTSVQTTKNASKLAKYLLSGTRTALLPVFNMEVDKLPDGVSTKLKNLGVSVPRGTRYSLEFTERFFKSTSLKQYLRSGISPSERKVLLFQVLDALRTCRKTVPGFMHNNINSDNITILQVTPSLSGGGTRSSWRTDVRLGGFEKCTFENDTPITNDLQGVATMFVNSGGNPEGTSAFLDRMIQKTSYEDVLKDPYFKDLDDPVVTGGGKKKVQSKTKHVKEEFSKRDDSTISSSLSVSSTSLSSSYKKPKKLRQKSETRSKHYRNPVYKALRADQFLQNPGSNNDGVSPYMYSNNPMMGMPPGGMNPTMGMMPPGGENPLMGMPPGGMNPMMGMMPPGGENPLMGMPPGGMNPMMGMPPGGIPNAADFYQQYAQPQMMGGGEKKKGDFFF